MATTIKGNEGSLNGTSAVTAVAAPAGTATRATPDGAVSVYNKDTVAHDITFQKNKGGTITEIQKSIALAVGATTVLTKKVALDATNESLEIKSNAAGTTFEPTFDVLYLEKT